MKKQKANQNIVRTIKIKEVKAKIFAFKSAANLQSLFLFDFFKFNPSNKLNNICDNYKNNTQNRNKKCKNHNRTAYKSV